MRIPFSAFGFRYGLDSKVRLTHFETSISADLQCPIIQLGSFAIQHPVAQNKARQKTSIISARNGKGWTVNFWNKPSRICIYTTRITWV